MRSDHLEEIWNDYAARLRAFIRGRSCSSGSTGLGCKEAAPRNLIVDRYRRRRPLEVLPDDLDAPVEPPAEDDPRTRLAFSLRPTVDEPPSPCRKALVATEYEELTQRQPAREKLLGRTFDQVALSLLHTWPFLLTGIAIAAVLRHPLDARRLSAFPGRRCRWCVRRSSPA